MSPAKKKQKTKTTSVSMHYIWVNNVLRHFKQYFSYIVTVPLNVTEHCKIIKIPPLSPTRVYIYN